MASRFITQVHFDYCFHPVRISKLGRSYYVPCGKCDGCLLHKANEWSFRVGDEIENNPFSIFFTLTYSNTYVPKVKCVGYDGELYRYHSTYNDYRFNGKLDVLRTPIDFYSKYFNHAPLTNYPDDSVFGVCRKDDIQLWLKLLRKDLYDNYYIQRGSLRYYIISEYGPGKVEHHGKYRPHYHGVIFPKNEEVARILLGKTSSKEAFRGYSLLYKNWQMCDASLFEQYTSYCNSGTRHYVTEYITGTTYLPPIYKDEAIKPFKLSSKSQATVGFSHFDPKEVCQSIERGVIEYHKRVPRVERNYIFQYPPAYVHSLFPKCSRYNMLDYSGLFRIYGFIHNIRKIALGYDSLPDGLTEIEFRYQDLGASMACNRVCRLMGWSTTHYVDVLDTYYYQKAQSALRYQYETQENNISNPLACILFYSNWKDWLFDDTLAHFVTHHEDNVRNFLYSFGLNLSSDLKSRLSDLNSSMFAPYRSEVSDIIANADKSKKINAVGNTSPHIV